MLGSSLLIRLALAAGVAGVALAGAYVKGRVDGAAIAKAETLKATIEALQTRGEIDDTIKTASDAELCVALGGVWIENACN
jgi:ribosomal protein S3